METLLTFITVLAWPMAVVFGCLFIFCVTSLILFHLAKTNLSTGDYTFALWLAIWSFFWCVPSWAWLGVRYFA